MSVTEFTWEVQSAENRRKEGHLFWLRLRHVVILISKDRTSVSNKMNGITLIGTLTVSTTAFERTKEKFKYGFRQTGLLQGTKNCFKLLEKHYGPILSDR